MRLDKFLKVSRLIKRRTVAKELADQGRVVINGRPAKASTDVRLEDILEIKLGHKLMTIKVTDLKESAKKEEALNLYEVLKEESSIL